MSNRFHNKWHRSSHHTYKNPNIIDSGWDPIASRDAPFRGDFVMQPGLPSADPGDPDEKWYMEAKNIKTADLYPYDEDTNGVSVHGNTGGNSVKIEPASGNETMNKIVTTVGEETYTLKLPNVDGELAIGADSIISKTWAELKAMRDANNGAGSLVSGHWYRITDYVATTSQADTQSANHPFDIIVMADEANKLNENAHAIQHAGDTYFNGCKLEAWKIKYCLDNDANRFSWADTTNGKGVVYRLIDEFGNDCPYDFKGIQFKRWAITNVTSTKISDVSSLVSSFSYSETGKCFAYKGSNISVNDTVLVVDASTSQWYYTFSDIVSGYVVDMSLTASNNVCGNKIGLWYYSGKPTLNRIVFFGSSCYSNTLDSDCSSNTFGSGCSYNTVGSYCSYNTVGSYCNSNTFGSYCSSNTFGSYCSSNTFGSYCNSNTFGSYCSSNTFGRSCYTNTVGSYCDSNTLDSNCNSNTLGDYCNSNTFGSYCNSNIFGVSGSIKSYYQNIIFENGNSGIELNCTSTLSYSSQYRNVLIALGTNDGSSAKTINDSNVDQTFKTTYQPANSRVVSV